MDNNVFSFIIDYAPIFGGEIEEGEQELLANGGNNMDNILEEYRLFLGVKYRRMNSQTRYLNAAGKFLGFVNSVDAGEIQRYLIFLNQTQKPNAVTSNIVGLNRFLVYLKRDDLRVSTPSWKQITRDTISREQIMELIQYAKNNCHHMDYLILLMVRDLDCRNHEIVKTQWSWIHGDKILFQECKTGDTMGRLTPELREALEHWQTITPYKDVSFVFTVQKGQFKGRPLAVNGWYVRSLVNRVSMRVIGRRLNPQDLRASVITAEYTAYVNPKIIQMKARHRSEKTTQRYNHVDEALVATYIESGTIFNNDTGPVLKDKPGIKADKRGYINTFTPSTLITGEEDNTRFSFSFSFSVYGLIGWPAIRLGWSKPCEPIACHIQSAFTSEDGYLGFTTEGHWTNLWGGAAGDRTAPFSSCTILSSHTSSFDYVVYRVVTGTVRVFCTHFFVYLSPQNNTPCLCIAPSQVFFCGSTPRCDETRPSERYEDEGVQHLWRSNPGQVRTLEYEGGVE